MADKEDVEETAPRGADWEVVSLTASTYAAAPSPDTGEVKGSAKGDLVDINKSETSNPLFMSGHFVFPPNQHENLPLEPENTEILGDSGVSESAIEEGEKSYVKDEDDWNIEKLTKSDDFRETPYFDEKGNKSTVSDADFSVQEESIYNSAKFHSFHGESILGESNIDDEDRVLAESVESSDSPLGSDVANVPKHTSNYDGSGLPYAAWLKKQAASLYGHAKEANTFWSIFVAAAVMGLVIIGQQWQQERWQVLHHRWHSGVYDEKFGMIVGPISRLKEAIVGGTRRGLSVRGSTSRDH